VVGDLALITFGKHNFGSPGLTLRLGLIKIGPQALIGARALLVPGTAITTGAFVGSNPAVVGCVAIAGSPFELHPLRHLLLADFR
jgi:acetyltransferase-like isoleucine patch superfamily enzyme